MTDEVKENIKDFAPWINRILLGIVAFFLIQTNSKFNEVIAKLDVVIVTQATYAERLHDLEDDIRENKEAVKRFEANIANFYERYGYLFSERTKRKLE